MPGLTPGAMSVYQNAAQSLAQALASKNQNYARGIEQAGQGIAGGVQQLGQNQQRQMAVQAAQDFATTQAQTQHDWNVQMQLDKEKFQDTQRRLGATESLTQAQGGWDAAGARNDADNLALGQRNDATQLALGQRQQAGFTNDTQNRWMDRADDAAGDFRQHGYRMDEIGARGDQARETLAAKPPEKPFAQQLAEAFEMTKRRREATTAGTPPDPDAGMDSEITRLRRDALLAEERTRKAQADNPDPLEEYHRNERNMRRYEGLRPLQRAQADAVAERMGEPTYAELGARQAELRGILWPGSPTPQTTPAPGSDPVDQPSPEELERAREQGWTWDGSGFVR